MGFILIALLLGGIAQLVYMVATAKGKHAHRKVGDGRGLTLAQMQAQLGRHQAESINEEGDLVCQWMMTSAAGAYHYVYVFRNGVCQGLAYRSHT